MRTRTRGGVDNKNCKTGSTREDCKSKELTCLFLGFLKHFSFSFPITIYILVSSPNRRNNRDKTLHITTNCLTRAGRTEFESKEAATTIKGEVCTVCVDQRSSPPMTGRLQFSDRDTTVGSWVGHRTSMSRKLL